MQNNTPTQILDLLVNGDRKIIKNLYDNVLPKVGSFVMKNKGNSDDANEIFQDALYQLIVRAKTNPFTINTSFDAYLFTVCKNLWYKKLNKSKKEVRNDGVFELKENDDTDLASILFQERWDLFEETFSKLNEKCKLLLKDYFGKVPYSVIVEKFSYANENTAFQRVFKCKTRLKELVKKDPRYKNLL